MLILSTDTMKTVLKDVNITLSNRSNLMKGHTILFEIGDLSLLSNSLEAYRVQVSGTFNNANERQIIVTGASPVGVFYGGKCTFL